MVDTGSAAYPLQYEGAALTEQEMHDETAWNEHMRKVNWIREDPVFQFTRYTDVEMTPDPRDADMGPFELLQWDHIRQRNVSAGAQRGEASGSGSQSECFQYEQSRIRSESHMPMEIRWFKFSSR